MSKLNLEVTHNELAIIRALLGKTNDTIPGASDLFSVVADMTDDLGIDRIDIKIQDVDGVAILKYHSIGL